MAKNKPTWTQDFMNSPTVQNTLAASKAKTEANKQMLAPTAVKPFEAPKLIDNSAQFEMQKNLASQRLNAGEQGQQQALNRRFAMLGGGPSGASIKATQNLGTELGMQREQALGGIDLAKMQDIARQQENIQGLTFQGTEAQRAQELAAQEAAKQRAMGQSQFEQSFGEQARMNAFQRRMGKKAFDTERIDQAFNKAVAMGQLNSKQAEAIKNYLKQFGGGNIKLPDSGSASTVNTPNSSNIGLY